MKLIKRMMTNGNLTGEASMVVSDGKQHMSMIPTIVNSILLVIIDVRKFLKKNLKEKISLHLL